MTIKVVYTWKCQQCDAHGNGPKSNTEAEKHTKATQHSTVTSGRGGKP